MLNLLKCYLRHHGRHVLGEAGALLTHPRHVRSLTWKSKVSVRQEIQESFHSHKSIAEKSHKSIFIDSHKGRRKFHTLLPELSPPPNSLSMFQAKSCERKNIFI